MICTGDMYLSLSLFEIPFLTNITASFSSTNVGYHLVFKMRQNCPASTGGTLVIKCIAARFYRHTRQPISSTWSLYIKINHYLNFDVEHTFGDIWLPLGTALICSSFPVYVA